MFVAVRLALDKRIDPDFEEATEGEEVEKKEKLKSKWARLEAMVGTAQPLATRPDSTQI